MSNTAIDANETLRQLEMHIGWATGINKEACIAMCKDLRTALANAPEVVTVDALRAEYHGYPVPRDEQGAVMDVWTFLEKRANGLKITAAPNGGA